MDNLALEKTAIRNLTYGKKKEISIGYIASARRFINTPWRMYLHETIFRSKSTQSKVFAVILLFFIFLSSTSVILHTVPELSFYHKPFEYIIWFVTILFSIEYFARILAVPVASRYLFSFLGIIDFISIFPLYLNLVGIDILNFLLVLRLIRLFRLFQVFDLFSYTDEAGVLLIALQASRHKIAIFIMAVVISVTFIGSLMYVIEGNRHGFDSIPRGIYWAIVTITTVGYGDLAPHTPAGQVLASLLMLLGFSTIVVPTSIVSTEIARQRDEKKEVLEGKTCLDCGMKGHDIDASYCKYCGSRLWG